MRLSKQNAEIRSTDDWYDLAPPAKPEHWAPGRSAMEFSRVWFPDPGHPIVPPELSTLFAGSPIGPVTFHQGEPEALIRFDDIPKSRQADLAATAFGSSGLVASTIEAKERESFDKPVGIRLASAGEGSRLPERIRRLSLGLFGTDVTPAIRSLFYQLLYGTAASLCFAERSKATAAVFIVFEFRSAQTPIAAIRANQDGLDAFVRLLTTGRVCSLAHGQLTDPIFVPGNQHFTGSIPLYLGKVVRHL
jgi:hypothetical protein